MKKRISEKIARYTNRWRRSYVNRGMDHPRTARLHRNVINMAKIYATAT